MMTVSDKYCRALQRNLNFFGLAIITGDGQEMFSAARRLTLPAQRYERRPTDEVIMIWTLPRK